MGLRPTDNYQKNKTNKTKNKKKGKVGLLNPNLNTNWPLTKKHTSWPTKEDLHTTAAPREDLHTTATPGERGSFDGHEKIYTQQRHQEPCSVATKRWLYYCSYNHVLRQQREWEGHIRDGGETMEAAHEGERESHTGKKKGWLETWSAFYERLIDATNTKDERLGRLKR